MSSSKIELELYGIYGAGKMFSQGQKDLKKFGSENKDMIDSSRAAVRSLAGVFEGQLNGAISSTYNLIGDIARGGLWGAMGSLATMAIGAIADKLNEAKVKAKEFADSLKNDVVEGWRAWFSETGSGFEKVAAEIDRTKKDVADLNAALGGEITSNANIKVQELHVQTLQKLTDEMSEAGKKVILAQENFEKAQIMAAANSDVALQKLGAAQEASTLAFEKRRAAEEALAQAQAQSVELHDKYAGVLSRYTELKRMAANFEEMALNGDRGAREILQGVLTEKTAIEKEHKDVLALAVEADRNVNDRKAALSQAIAEEEASSRAVDAANKNIEVVKANNASMIAEANFGLAELVKAQNAEKEASEKSAAVDAEKVELEKAISNIKAVCLANDVEYAEYVALYTQALKDGYSEQTINVLLQKKLNAALEERAAQMEDENKGVSSGGAAKGGKTVDLVEAIKEGVGATTVNTSVNAGEVGSGVDSAQGPITISELQREMRDEERKSRDHLNAVKGSQSAIKAFMQGKMSPEMANKMMEKMRASGFTVNDFKTMTSGVLKSQLLTKSELVAQKKSIENIEKKLEKMGFK